MQDSITKALLFVIALSTSIIAVELIPQYRVNNAKLLCAKYKGLNTNYEGTVIKDLNEPILRTTVRLEELFLNSDVGDINVFCESL